MEVVIRFKFSRLAALFLDGGIDEADRIFGMALFGNDERLHKVWTNLPLHPLQVRLLIICL